MSSTTDTTTGTSTSTPSITPTSLGNVPTVVKTVYFSDKVITFIFIGAASITLIAFAWVMYQIRLAVIKSRTDDVEKVPLKPVEETKSPSAGSGRSKGTVKTAEMSSSEKGERRPSRQQLLPTGTISSTVKISSKPLRYGIDYKAKGKSDSHDLYPVEIMDPMLRARVSGFQVVAKKFKKSSSSSKNESNSFKDETQFFKQVNSATRCFYKVVGVDSGDQVILFRKSKTHALTDAVKKLTKMEVLTIVKDLAIALQAVHTILDQPYILFKINNFDVEKDSHGRYCVVLTDYRHLLPCNQDMHISRSKQPITPETSKTHGKPNKESDVFALGMLMFQLLTGKEPDTRFK